MIYFEELSVLYTNLFLGIFLIIFASFIIWQAKKYYTIKNSMEFYLMMVNKHDISAGGPKSKLPFPNYLFVANHNY